MQADALTHRDELNKQVSDMLDRVLPEERDLLRLYFGVGQRWHSLNKLIDESTLKSPLFGPSQII